MGNITITLTREHAVDEAVKKVAEKLRHSISILTDQELENYLERLDVENDDHLNNYLIRD